jgi:endo-1,4-beta-xylanase
MSIKKLFSAALACAAFATIAFGQAVDPCTQTAPLTGGTTIDLSSSNNQSMDAIPGTPFHYEVWTDAGNASGCSITYYGEGKGGGGAFKAVWQNPNDYLGRVGYYWNNGGHYTQYKNMYADYNYTRSANETAGSYSYVGIYGWARNPSATQENRKLIEYYIVEDWFKNEQMGPSNIGSGCQTVGNYTMDGGTYNVYTCIRDHKPSIDGDKTFTQYFAIRQGMTSSMSSRRTCGSISITEHFKKWDSMGLTLGNMYEAKFLVEAASSTGWFDMSYLSFSQEDFPRGAIGANQFGLMLYASPANGGTVNSSPDAIAHNTGASVQITATPKDGWEFVEWTGGHTGTANPATVTMSQNRIITAKFQPTGGGENMIKDGNFPSGSVNSNNSSNWNLGVGQYYGNSQASANISNGSVTINISNIGTEPHHPQMVQQGFAIDQGMSYLLTFTARAASERSIGVIFQKAGGDWETYGAEDFDLTTADAEYSFIFKMNSASDPAAQLAFNLGGSTASVTISDVSLVYYTGNTSVAARPAIPAAATKGSSLRVSAKKTGISVKFKAKGTGSAELRLYGLKGELISKANVNTVNGKSYAHTFNPGKLPNGFYIVSVNSNGVVERSKAIMPK